MMVKTFFPANDASSCAASSSNLYRMKTVLLVAATGEWTRLRVGEILVDAKGFSRLQSRRVGVWPLVLIAFAGPHLPTGLASVLIATNPLFTVLLAHWLTIDERMTPRHLAGVLTKRALIEANKRAQREL